MAPASSRISLTLSRTCSATDIAARAFDSLSRVGPIMLCSTILLTISSISLDLLAISALPIISPHISISLSLTVPLAIFSLITLDRFIKPRASAFLSSFSAAFRSTLSLISSAALLSSITISTSLSINCENSSITDLHSLTVLLDRSSGAKLSSFSALESISLPIDTLFSVARLINLDVIFLNTATALISPSGHLSTLAAS